MNTDRELDRLLRLSRTAQVENGAPDEVPFGFTTRVCSLAWNTETESARAWMFGLRWGVACATLVMIVAAGLNASLLGPAKISADSVFHQQLSELVLP